MLTDRFISAPAHALSPGENAFIAAPLGEDLETIRKLGIAALNELTGKPRVGAFMSTGVAYESDPSSRACRASVYLTELLRTLEKFRAEKPSPGPECRA